MEIEFKLDDGSVYDFEPDFDVAINYVDIREVTWNFQDGNHSGTVASLFGGSSEYEYPTTYILPIV